MRRRAGGRLTPPSDLPDRVRIPTGEATTELRVQGSRFLARAARADGREAALALRDEARRRFHAATHHVFALRTLDGSLHLDDDGEPAGTAGRPVASALERADFRRAAVVVTRWFGGTKLGTGGLARAYGEVAAAALDRLTPGWAAPGRSIVVTFPYEDTGAVMGVVEASRAVRSGEAWGEEATVRLLVPGVDLEGLRRSLRDATVGRCHVRVGNETVLVPVPPVP